MENTQQLNTTQGELSDKLQQMTTTLNTSVREFALLIFVADYKSVFTFCILVPKNRAKKLSHRRRK